MSFLRPTATIRRSFWRTGAYVFLTTVFCALPALSWAQRAPRASSGIRVGDRDPIARELADEYADILGQLQDIISDYTDYLSEIGDNSLIAATSFSTFNKGLANGRYSDSAGALSIDLGDYQARLATLEKECEEGKPTRSAKACRVVRSLKREIKSLSDQLAAYQTHVDESAQSQEELERKIKKIAALSQEMSQQYAEVARKALEKATEELRQAELTVPKAPKSVEHTPPPATKGKLWIPWQSNQSGDVGTRRSANGVMTVTSTAIPVVIINPNGSIEITGTSARSIQAALDFEVSASSLAREKTLASEMGLKVMSEDKRYLVEVTVPQLTDPNSRLLHNDLVVSVPIGLRVECKGAYGDQSITGLTGPVNATAQYASVNIDGCSGGVVVSNSMGSIRLSDVVGRIQASSDHGDVEISDCRGDMQIVNSYSGVDLSGSRGNVTIQNSGEITVADHVGNVSVKNQYGQVIVTNVTGDVDVRNAYQSVRIENVDGLTSVENSNSPIEVLALRGRTKLTNQYAKITGEGIRGPFEVVGRGGAIDLDLTGPLSGSSSINSTYGPVSLVIPRSADLLISLRTSYGDISSTLPIAVNAQGSLRTGVLRMGQARDSLSVVGTNASIDIATQR